MKLFFESSKAFKEKSIIVGNFKIEDQEISFNTKDQIDEVKKLLDDDDSSINPYYENFKTHEFDLSNENNSFYLKLSKYGFVLLKQGSLDNAIEIDRRRVDEIGTNEANILKRGSD